MPPLGFTDEEMNSITALASALPFQDEFVFRDCFVTGPTPAHFVTFDRHVTGVRTWAAPRSTRLQ
jgi:hypothetical protein